MINSRLNLSAVSLLLKALLLSISFGGAAFAVQEVTDSDLSDVSGADGITVNASLVWNTNRTQYELSSKVLIGFEHFNDDSTKTLTYLTFGGFGGGMEIVGLKIDSFQGPADIGDYVDITLPRYIGFNDFGFQSMSVRSVTVSQSTDSKTFDTNTLPAPTSNYGQWLYNGSAVVTGHVYIWPAK